MRGGTLSTGTRRNDTARKLGQESEGPGEVGEAALGGKGRATRKAILAAATERFGRDGYKATSLADIARDAGIGGPAIYPYFENKKALFAQALDDDVTAIIEEAVSSVLVPGDNSWRESLVGSLLDSVGRHPLAQRVLAGWEQGETIQVIDLPALADLRAAVAERLRKDQETGLARADIDPVLLADGGVTIFLSMLMSVVQLGEGTISRSGPGVMAVVSAAIDPVDPAR